MTVVSLRCHECDEVKREECVEMRGSGNNICDECKTVDLPDVPDEDESEDGVSEEEIEEEAANTPTEEDNSPENTENGERDKKPLEESFNEQDPLEW